jgi:V/A-type H+-transporting ATPase subunit F
VKYLFLGEAELVTAFRFTGVEGIPTTDAESARRNFLAATKNTAEQYHILIVTEQVAQWLRDELTGWQLSGEYPLIVEVPGLGGPLDGKQTLVDAIREAIGIHV